MVRRYKNEDEFLLSGNTWHTNNKAYLKIRVLPDCNETRILVFYSRYLYMYTVSELELMGFSEVTSHDVAEDGSFLGKEWLLET
jgi:hypothetical protein